MIAFLRPSLTACLYHGPLLEHSSTPSVPPLALATGEEDSCDRGGVSGLSVLCRVGVVWGEVVRYGRLGVSCVILCVCWPVMCASL